MNKLIPINKDIEFKTSIGDITSISLDKDLTVDKNDIKGNLLISGTYKVLKTSTIDEKFSYSIPVEITLGDNYSLDKVSIDIDDFHYDINDNKLVVDIDILISNIIENISPDIEISDSRDNKDITIDIVDDIDVNNDYEEVSTVKDKNDSIFTKFLDTDDNYVTYKVYFVREGDTLEDILEKYNITKEELSNYNNLDEMNINSKIVIPCVNEN